MLHELRIYTVVPGRLVDTVNRYRDHALRLFERHGIRNVGRWAGTAGPNGPSFVYVLSYASYEERESQWQAFGKDADWAKVRIETVAKEEMTERVERMFITPSPAWTPPESSPAQTIGGLHELILAEVPLGHAGHATTYLRDICIPLIERLGGRVMMVADVTVGARLPRVVLMIAWSDANHRQHAWSAINSDQGNLAAILKERLSRGRPSIGARDVYILEPTEYALPQRVLLSQA